MFYKINPAWLKFGTEIRSCHGVTMYIVAHVINDNDELDSVILLKSNTEDPDLIRLGEKVSIDILLKYWAPA